MLHIYIYDISRLMVKFRYICLFRNFCTRFLAHYLDDDDDDDDDD